MARYIDAEKLVEKIKRCSAFKNMKSFWYESELLQNVVLDLIDNLPTADVVEVPYRCKNCGKKQGEINGCGDVYCSLHKGYFDKDAFCSYGERSDT